MDPFRWTTLRNISVRMYHGKSGRPSVSGATNLGAPTAIAASGIICVGTANGWVTVFDYSQNVKCVCGNEQIVTAAGRVTALSISSDQTFVAVGHASGHVYLYDLAKPSQPARTVNPVTLKSVEEGKAEGHLAETSEILFLGFVGSRHTAIVSADTDGLAFYHSLGKVLGLANNDVLRILGKYPSSVPRAVDGRSQSASASPPLLAMQPLPLGTQNHPTDDYSLIALLTGLKLVVAGLKPSARTWWRCLNKMPSAIAHEGPTLSDEKGKVGALAWLPSVNEEDPLLAFSWENKLRIVRVEHEVRRRPASRSNGSRVGRNEKDQVVKTLKFHTLSSHSSKGRFDDDVEDATPLYESSSPIHAIQWLNPRVSVEPSRGCRKFMIRLTHKILLAPSVSPTPHIHSPRSVRRSVPATDRQGASWQAEVIAVSNPSQRSADTHIQRKDLLPSESKIVTTEGSARQQLTRGLCRPRWTCVSAPYSHGRIVSCNSSTRGISLPQ